MYSKERGVTRPPVGNALPSERRPAYRQPPRQRLQVPPNYSGHAIVDGEERPLGSPPEESVPARLTDPLGSSEPTPRFDGLPRVSELGGVGDSHRHQPRTLQASFESREADDRPLPSEGEDPSPADDSQERVTLPAAVPPRDAFDPPRGGSLFGGRFPFGHGLGLEELLLLGLILLLLHESDGEERGDLDETVLLLGLLLLLG